MRLYCVGIGPGGGKDLTGRAREVLESVELIVGYATYVDLVRDDFPHAEFLSTGMRGERKRCELALEQASAGRRVAVVCSGDAGVYGMAGLLIELAPAYDDVEVQVVPGVSAANGGAALLGAPLAHDWCCISLSDLLTPWQTIEERLDAAARVGLCVCLYNPASRGRADHLCRACDVLLRHLDPHTVCGVVRNVGRAGESYRVLTLAELRGFQADMLTCVFVGNATTRVVDGRMVTPRGYALDADTRTGGTVPCARGTVPPARVYASEAGRAQVLVFGGTTEGRLLVEWLDARETCDVVACVATEYGASLLDGGGRVTVLRGPLDEATKRRLMDEHDFACIVDATHPYAKHISQSVARLGKDHGVPVVRVRREDCAEGAWTSVRDVGQAARHLANTSGNVLLTTGSKDLATFVDAIPNAAERLYVRVLPVPAAIERTQELGVPTSHVIAMQGPFSAELNAALVRDLRIEYLVTKRSGAVGGFASKVEAAQNCGIELVVIERPCEPQDTAADGSYVVAKLEEAKKLLEDVHGI
ncbi:MAG: precorrin-3B C(17)-methyltransferase [Coriobacteriales bacterium]|nr:precorrin-3B C(17)-methyltransferase [Coriobacteriales bacterium]